jgi:hypothetical protein
LSEGCGGVYKNTIYELDPTQNKRGVVIRGSTKIMETADVVDFPNEAMSSLIVREARYDDQVVNLFELASLGGKSFGFELGDHDCEEFTER